MNYIYKSATNLGIVITLALVTLAGEGSNQPIMAQMSQSGIQRKQPAVGWFAAGSAPQNYDMGVDRTMTYNGQQAWFH